MAVIEHASNALAYARHQADRLVSPQTRQKAYDATRDFAYRRPLLFSFILAQTLLALAPLALFISFATGVAAVAGAAALLFILFWVGLAALGLAAALSISFGLAVLAWAWGAGAYLLVRFAFGIVFTPGTGSSGGKGAVLGDEWLQRKAALSREWDPVVVKREEEDGRGSGGEVDGVRVTNGVGGEQNGVNGGH